MVNTSPSSGWGSAQTIHPSASLGRVARIPGKAKPYFTISKVQNMNMLDQAPTAQAVHKAVRCLLCSPSPRQMFLSRRKLVTAKGRTVLSKTGGSMEKPCRSMAERHARGWEFLLLAHKAFLSVRVIQQNWCEFAECFRWHKCGRVENQKHLPWESHVAAEAICLGLNLKGLGFFWGGLLFLFGFLTDFFSLFLCGRKRRGFNKGLAQSICVPADTYLFVYLQSGQSEPISRCNWVKAWTWI